MACAAGGGDCGPRYLLAAGSSVPVESGGRSAGFGVACSAVAVRDGEEPPCCVAGGSLLAVRVAEVPEALADMLFSM